MLHPTCISESPTSCVSEPRALMHVSYTTRGIPWWNYYFTLNLAAFLKCLWMKLTLRDLHFHVTLLSTYFLTFTIPHDAPSGTIVRGVCLMCVLKSKGGLHIRLLAEHVLVSGWVIVPEIQGLVLQHLDAVFFGWWSCWASCARCCRLPRTSGSHPVRCLHVNVVSLCVDAWRSAAPSRGRRIWSWTSRRISERLQANSYVAWNTSALGGFLWWCYRAVATSMC